MVYQPNGRYTAWVPFSPTHEREELGSVSLYPNRSVVYLNSSNWVEYLTIYTGRQGFLVRNVFWNDVSKTWCLLLERRQTEAERRTTEAKGCMFVQQNLFCSIDQKNMTQHKTFFVLLIKTTQKSHVSKTKTKNLFMFFLEFVRVSPERHNMTR